MQTVSLRFISASLGQCGWAWVVVARTVGASTVLRGLRLSVLAKGIRTALLVPALKSGCHGQRGFGRVKSGAVCTGIGMLWRGDGAPTAVATASVRSNSAFERDVNLPPK